MVPGVELVVDSESQGMTPYLSSVCGDGRLPWGKRSFPKIGGCRGNIDRETVGEEVLLGSPYSHVPVEAGH